MSVVEQSQTIEIDFRGVKSKEFSLQVQQKETQDQRRLNNYGKYRKIWRDHNQKLELRSMERSPKSKQYSMPSKNFYNLNSSPDQT
tara:strand:- start:2 stop:259 length:258 start_codon:yes stop_codon:yes gene_type:complete